MADTPETVSTQAEAATDIIAEPAESTPTEGELASTLAKPTPAPEPAPAEAAPAKPSALSRAVSYVKTHAISVLLVAVIACVAIGLLAEAWLRQSQLPSDDLIVADARARVEVPAYSGGIYGLDDELYLVDVEIGQKSLSTDAPEGTVLEDSFGATGYADVDVVCTFRNETVTVTKTLTLGYAKQDGEWIGVGNEQNARTAYQATGGVEQDKVVAAMPRLLGKADGGATSSPTLVQTYSDGEFQVIAEEFDPTNQTETMTIRCSAGSTFWEYGCDITATFAFRPVNGTWELTGASASEGAVIRGYSPIIGTWNGTFRSQESNSYVCYGAKGAPFVLVITHAWSTSSGSKIEGTLTSLAHFHPRGEEAVDSTEGDETFEEVPFTGRLVEGYNSDTDSEMAFVCELPDSVGGTLELTIGFGTTADPTEVVAVVKTTHVYEETILLLFPYDEMAIYSDTYVLQKTE